MLQSQSKTKMEKQIKYTTLTQINPLLILKRQTNFNLKTLMAQGQPLKQLLPLMSQPKRLMQMETQRLMIQVL